MRRMRLLIAMAGTITLYADGQITSPPTGVDTIGPAPSVYYTPSPALVTPDLESLLSAHEPAYTIQPDDALTINVYGVKEFALKSARVSEDGTVHLPLVGSVKLAGLTVSQAEEAVDGLLISGDFIKTPGTTIETVERPGHMVTVSGDIVKPGMFPATGRHTLSDFLALAGGLRDTASTTLTLRRSGFASPIEIPLGADPVRSRFRSIPIFAGDEIHVSGVGVMYVVGALKNQGAFPLKSTTPTTVLQAITLAGGMGYEAAADSSQILRTQGDKRIMMPVKVGRIVKGKEADVALQNDDILYVPSQKAKAALKGGAAGLIVSLASTYIYAHP
jgi:polysaccharide biosynthesis/export protein